jgi:hypothetical protein
MKRVSRSAATRAEGFEPPTFASGGRSHSLSPESAAVIRRAFGCALRCFYGVKVRRGAQSRAQFRQVLASVGAAIVMTMACASEATAPRCVSRVGPGCTWRQEFQGQQTQEVEVRRDTWYRVCPEVIPAPITGVKVIPDSTFCDKRCEAAPANG